MKKARSDIRLLLVILTWVSSSFVYSGADEFRESSGEYMATSGQSNQDSIDGNGRIRSLRVQLDAAHIDNFPGSENLLEIKTISNSLRSRYLEEDAQPLDSDADANRILEALGLCDSDCDDDFDCEGNLVCYHRSSGEDVPGCSGTSDNGDDYCVEPVYMDPGPDFEVFRLRMYDRDWCAACENNICVNGTNILIERCVGDSRVWTFLTGDNETTQVQLDGSDLCWEMVDDPTDDITQRAIILMHCDPERPRQLFSSGKGHFSGYKFQFKFNRKCVTQDEEPSSDEMLYAASCRKAIAFETSYWEKY